MSCAARGVEDANVESDESELSLVRGVLLLDQPTSVHAE
jgi:hypothetical protein